MQAARHRIAASPLTRRDPRDPQTGYPLGGAAVMVNTFELRMPYPNLPLVGNNLGFVIFHDMGNVFNSSDDVFPSFINFHQPNESACRTIPTVNTNPNGSLNVQEEHLQLQLLVACNRPGRTVSHTDRAYPCGFRATTLIRRSSRRSITTRARFRMYRSRRSGKRGISTSSSR